MPISNENFIGRTKTLKLVKNVGGPNAIGGDVVSPNTYGRVSATYIHHWHKKERVTYENNVTNPALAYPTNFCPLWGVVAFSADSSQKLGENTIFMDVRNEMYFKDI